MAGERWAGFDCYGTLIDWDSGIGGVLGGLWPGADRYELLDRYHEIEPRVQLDGRLTYREVLTQGLVLLAESEGLELADADRTRLADSLPSWAPHPEVPAALAELRRRGWRLAILSNTDPDYLDASLERIRVPVDARITAAEAGSYKPAHGHWERLFEVIDTCSDETASGLTPTTPPPDPLDRRYVHVAASLFHDIAPAAELGLAAVWINRLGETSDLPRAAELSDLAALPDTLDRLVPA